MDVATIDIILSPLVGLACAPCGAFLAFMPMKANQMTTKQSKASQMLCFIVAIIFIALMLMGRDLETWAMLIGLILGFAIGKIGPVHRWATATWDFFTPKSQTKARPKRNGKRGTSANVR